jgi:hypothetical protein
MEFDFRKVQQEVQGDFTETSVGDRVVFRKTCQVSGQPYEVTISARQYFAWRGGKMIQNVCPELSADQREFLISRQTPAEFEALFGDEE